jgi:2-methylisocitrate lyase-like PEP mutase family enzyme
VWDAASARAAAAAGFPVVATSSGAVAETLGYGDHEGAPATEMLAAAARIIRAVEVPVTVDFEAGYGMAPAGTVEALEGIGAAGCNLEDTDHATGILKEPGRHAEWLAAVRDAAAAKGYGLVINARLDVFINDGGATPPPELLEEAVARGLAYVAAGADCVYPILLTARDTIAAFVRAVDAPVNILPLPAAPSVSELAGLGVARISYGTMIYRRTMEPLGEILPEIPS